MSSQEDYLDQLLRNIMNGGKDQPQPESGAEEAGAAEITAEVPGAAGGMADIQDEPEISGMDQIPDMPETGGMSSDTVALPEMYEMPVSSAGSGMPEIVGADGMPGMDGISGMADVDGLSGMPEMSGTPDDAAAMLEQDGMPGIAGMDGMSGMADVDGLSGMPEMSGTPDETAAVLGQDGLPGIAGMEMSGISGMDGISGMADVDGLSGVPEMSGTPDDAAAMFGQDGMSGITGMDGISGMADVDGMPGMPEMTGMSDDAAAMLEQDGMPGISGMDGISGMADVDGLPEIDEMPEMSVISDTLGDFEEDNEILGTPVEDTDLEALLKSLEDDTGLEEGAPDSPESADISSMSEEDVDRLLAESRQMPESSTDGAKEAFQGDVVDMLKGTGDSELREIQDLLEKSDNNEAVGDEIEDILRGAAQDGYQNDSGESGPGMTADGTDGEEGQLSPRQQKAMEKKRIKEEKAAARKAAKEARKAEKAARKAARKAGGGDGAQGAENAAGPAGGKTAAETEEAVDTAFLDSILSEAGKINGAETISSATGNYDAKVGNIIPEEDEAVVVEENAGSASSANNDLGIDLNNLFSGSAEAESAMMAGGDSGLEGFVSLDGGDMAGIIELGSEDEEESKPKKKGFFSRFLEFLTEEEEEEEENENIKLSEENQEIIEDLDKEKNKKDKKGKKGKKKVEKSDASAEDGEEGEDGEDKAGKKKKAKKPKKEKLPKEKEPVDPKNRLGLKKVMPIVLICLSLGVAIIITVYAFVDFTGNKAARDAYYDGDYWTCYQYLYGKDMNETEQIMFGKSQSILTIQLWLREYEMLEADGARLEALDALIRSVSDYPVLYEYAGRWNAAGEVAQEYAAILNLLYENYGLTEDQARAIAAEKNDIEYTRQVNAIVQGGSYGSWNEPEPEIEIPLQDELPEEKELPEGSFIDTNTSVQ